MKDTLTEFVVWSVLALAGLCAIAASVGVVWLVIGALS